MITSATEFHFAVIADAFFSQKSMETNINSLVLNLTNIVKFYTCKAVRDTVVQMPISSEMSFLQTLQKNYEIVLSRVAKQISWCDNLHLFT